MAGRDASPIRLNPQAPVTLCVRLAAVAGAVPAGWPFAPEEDELRTFTRFVVSGACLMGIGGHAGAESAREFWQNEWQRQQPRQSSLDRSGMGAARVVRRTGALRLLPGARGAVAGGSAKARPARTMPTVRVSNPDFYTYTPDSWRTSHSARCASSRQRQTWEPPQIPPRRTAPRTSAPAAPASDASPPPRSCKPAPSPGNFAARAAAGGRSDRAALFPTSAIHLVGQGSINAKAQAALARLAASDAVGLDPADYRVAMPDLQNADAGARPLRCCASSSRFRRKS